MKLLQNSLRKYKYYYICILNGEAGFRYPNSILVEVAATPFAVPLHRLANSGNMMNFGRVIWVSEKTSSPKYQLGNEAMFSMLVSKKFNFLARARGHIDVCRAEGLWEEGYMIKKYVPTSSIIFKKGNINGTRMLLE